jgi:putative drug exporter of the RND superfamily
VALGVLLDTIVVRSVLVTALNLDLGRWVWWPSRLARQPAPEEENLTGEPAGVS